MSLYFDGELDPDQKRRAEAALASDPAAAETLRSMAAVRDLVASLSRPRAPDVSVLVLNRIVADAERWSPWKTWGPYVGRGLGASAIAASLGLVVFLGGESRLGRLSAPPTARARGASEMLAARPPAQPAVPPPAKANQPESADPAPSPVQAPIVAESERPIPGRDQPPGFQELWATAGPRRDFVVTSAPDESTTATVETLLGQSTHRDFYKIVIPDDDDVARGDSGASVAFAARLDPSEYATLRGRLGSEFRDRVAIGDSEPEVAALLADVGRATAASPTPAAEVSFPQTRHAFRVHSGAAPTDRAQVDAAADQPDDPSVPPTPADPTSPSVVLIWIVGPAPD